MALLNVNPTRMELTKLKKRYNVARRGHKLLKDKRDELMKQFLEIVRKNKELRRRVETGLGDVYDNFLIASAVMSPQNMRQALMLPNFQTRIEVSHKNIMSVNVPVFKQTEKNKKTGYPYGYYGTTAELDNSVDQLDALLPQLLELAQVEKSAQMLASEIEKVRRRVNALEYVMIPQLEETIKYITMKLDENERGNLTRLMKVKEMIYTEKINP